MNFFCFSFCHNGEGSTKKVHGGDIVNLPVVGPAMAALIVCLLMASYLAGESKISNVDSQEVMQ